MEDIEVPAHPTGEVVYECSDGKYTYSNALMAASQVLANMYEDFAAGKMAIDDVVPLPGITGTTLKYLIRYCTIVMPTEDAAAKHGPLDPLTAAETAFCNSLGMDQPNQVNPVAANAIAVAAKIANAAEKLEIPSLKRITTRFLANAIIGRSADQIRTAFSAIVPENQDEEARMVEESSLNS